MLFSGLSLLTWLIIGWALFTSILVLLMIYRGMIGMHQEDQIFLTESARGFEAEAAAATARIARLRPYIRAATAIAGILAVSVAALWVVQTAQRF